KAGLARGAGKAQLLADAAFAWHEAGDSARARMLMAQVQPRQLSGATSQRFARLQAELALAEGQPAAALQVLQQPASLSLPAPLQARWHLARAQAFESSGDSFNAATERARAGLMLSGAARSDNQRA